MNCNDIKSGQLITPVKLRRETVGKDQYNARKVTYTEYATPMAKVRTISGGRRDRTDYDSMRLKLQAAIRYRTDMAQSDRVEVRGTEYRIASIDNVEMRNRWLVIELAEAVNE